MKRTALIVLALIGCGGVPPDSVDKTESAVAPPQGTFCKQNVNGHCMVDNGGTLGLTSYNCNGQTWAIFASIQQKQLTNGTYYEVFYPPNGFFSSTSLFLNCGDPPAFVEPMNKTSVGVAVPYLESKDDLWCSLLKFAPGTNPPVVVDQTGVWIHPKMFSADPASTGNYGTWGMSLYAPTLNPAAGVCTNHITFSWSTF